MATIDSREIIDQMIKDNGETYCKPSEDGPGEEPVMRIVEYTNAFGKITWGVVWFKEPVSPNRYLHETEFVRNPRVIWEREDLLQRHPYI